jgi:AraC family transcriptional activator of tynA and feaB
MGHKNALCAPADDRLQDRHALFDEWITDINQACGAFSATMLGDTFAGELRRHESGVLRLSVVDAFQACLYRNQKDIGLSDGQKYFAVLQVHGQAALEQGGQRTVLAKGDITILDAARPCSILLNDHSRQISLIIPRHMMERNLRHTRVACARAIPATSTLAVISAQLMLAILQPSDAGLAAQESEAILDALITLLKPAIGLSETPDSAHERMFRKACDFIDAHLMSEGLSPEWIAQSIGVSVRGLYRVFSGRGLLVAQCIQHRRLDRCAEALRETADGEKLASLGYRWGFADASHFSSAFKTRFGVPPGEYRRRFLLHA